MSKSPLRRALIHVATVVVALSFPGSVAGQEVVTIDASGFVPNLRTIDVGDSVMWLNLDMAGPHSTTSDKPAGDPDHWNVTLNYFEFYTRSFVRPGAFAYHDSVGGFTGTIIVTAPMVPRLEASTLADGQFIFQATGLTVGKTNVIQSSTNLTSWIPIQTNTAASISMTFSSAISPGRSFYRLVERQ